MTIDLQHRRAPQFGLTHRLALARETAGLQQQDLAETLGVSRATISNWENGVTGIRSLYLREWAMVCGVDLGWLKSGQIAPTPDGGKGQPSDYPSQVSRAVVSLFPRALVELAGAA